MGRFDIHTDKDQWCSNCRYGGHYKCKKKKIVKKTGKICECKCLIVEI